MLQRLSALIFSLFILFSLVACFSPPPKKDTDFSIIETNRQSISEEEVIHINNCGGKADTEQTTERSFSITIDGAGSLGIDTGIIEAKLGSQYSEYKNITKSIKLIAPPGTNMEFVLRWTEQQQLGSISANGQSGTYIISTPLQVEQASSKDLECITPTIGVAEPESTNIQPTQKSTEETLTCQNALKNLQSYLPGQNISGPSVLHPFEGCSEMAIQLNLVCIGRWGININSGQTIIIPQNITLVNGNIIVPNGNFSSYESDTMIEQTQDFWLKNCP